MYKDVSELLKLERRNCTDKCIVMGNGNSVQLFDRQSDIFTIGVNDIGRFHPVEILFIVDSLATFKRKGLQKRIEHIKRVKHKYNVIFDKNWGFTEENTYTFKTGAAHKLLNLDKNIFDTGLDSPWMAIQLAYKLGFKEIGLLGVDWTNNHFYAKDGEHMLVKAGLFEQIYRLYDNLRTELNKKGVKLYNLSNESRLDCLDYKDINEFTN